MWKIATVIMVLGLVGMAMPPAAAFHGTPYVAEGTAFFKPTQQFWNARVEWGGNQAFRVTISDPVSKVAMPSVTIQAPEGLGGVQFPLNIPTCSSFEIVEFYTAKDPQTQGKMLDLDGIQENCLENGPRNGDRHQHMVGNFMQHWYLDVGLGTPFDTEWEF